MDPRTTSRRTFLEPRRGRAARRRGAGRLRQLRPQQQHRAGGGGSAAAAARAAPATGSSPASPGGHPRQPPSTASTRPTPTPRSRRRRSRTTPTRRRSRRRSAPARRPTIIWGWGGGGLKSYVDASQVEDLTSWFGAEPARQGPAFPSSFGAATVDGKIYAMPCETVQPIVLYYNKKVFDKVGVAAAEVVGRHHGPGRRSSTPRASRRSRSAASPAGRT